LGIYGFYPLFVQPVVNIVLFGNGVFIYALPYFTYFLECRVVDKLLVGANARGGGYARKLAQGVGPWGGVVVGSRIGLGANIPDLSEPI